MHGSLQLLLATEADRSRHAAAKRERLAASARSRRPLARLAARVASAHGLPPRAAPGTEPQALGSAGAVSLRAR